MLLNLDLKGTEWVGINYFSQDKIGCNEIREGLDQHSLNQEKFHLPTRTIAKIFVFRLIYGGTSWSYVYDPDFNWVSNSSKFWQGIIDSFYEKYSGIKIQHDRWMNEAITTGSLVMPTGRIYCFAPYEDPRGGLKWPRTKIINYPVQGLGHDLTTIARVSLYKRIRKDDRLFNNLRFISTVHDSVILDIQTRDLETVISIIQAVLADVPRNFERLFNVPFSLPIRGEIKIGNNLLDMTEVKV